MFWKEGLDLKKIMGLMLFALFVCIACTSGNTKSQSKKQKEYTFLIYMNGSDLESEYSAGTEDLYEMMKVGSNDNINIVIETGGTNKWNNYYVDPNQNQRWLVQKSNMAHLVDLGQKNMGDGDTLRDFITWGVENFPAQKHVLILWNHGGGAISGFGYDEKYNYDTLLLAELRRGLDEAYKITNKKLEIIGFDACLMSSLETANIVAPYANYLVASTELEPAMGWEYSSFLQEASKDNIGGSKLGKAIADGFIKNAQDRSQGDFVTLSIIDLRKTDQLTKSFEKFISKASETIADVGTFNQISNSVSRSESYGGQSPEEGYSNMIDLGDLAKNLDSQYAEDRERILKAVRDAVVYEVKGKSKQNSSGISIYFPYYNKENLVYELPIYQTIGFSEKYNQFLSRYAEVASNDQTGVELASGNIQSKDGNYRLIVKDEDTNNVSNSMLVLGEEIDEEEILLYGGNPKTIYDEKIGQVEIKFNNKWMSLNGHLVYICPTNIQQDYIIYSLPVILNEEYANIRVVKYEDEEKYEIIGAWHGVIPESMAVRKETIPINEGDVIKPLFKIYNTKTKEIKDVQGKPFIIKEKPEIQLVDLSDKNFVIGFCIDDYARNQCYSEFVPIVE